MLPRDVFRFPDAETRWSGSPPRAEPFYGGEIGAAVTEWVRERGGTLGPDDMAAYEPIEREPVRATFQGAEVLTNPPPSSGGVLIAYALAALEEMGPRSDVEQLVRATEAANELRTEEFAEPSRRRFRHGCCGRSQATASAPQPISRCSTPTASCASVTCSNGTGSGLVVPGTGVHVNNMLGEEDLNPGGFHRIPPGRR